MSLPQVNKDELKLLLALAIEGLNAIRDQEVKDLYEGKWDTLPTDSASFEFIVSLDKPDTQARAKARVELKRKFRKMIKELEAA